MSLTTIINIYSIYILYILNTFFWNNEGETFISDFRRDTQYTLPSFLSSLFLCPVPFHSYGAVRPSSPRFYTFPLSFPFFLPFFQSFFLPRCRASGRGTITSRRETNPRASIPARFISEQTLVCCHRKPRRSGRQKATTQTIYLFARHRCRNTRP